MIDRIEPHEPAPRDFGPRAAAAVTHFELVADPGARAWLDVHAGTEPFVIAYEVHRCCGGGKICQVSIRQVSRNVQTERCATGSTQDGTEFLIDRRAAARLPARFGLTMRGLGPWRYLDLELQAEQWGDLLYT
jgi:hypothetical protein